MKRKLEICCGDIESVHAALTGGADRVELCSGLECGGLTPSRGLIRAAVEAAHKDETRQSRLLVHVLIRPREGDFLYSEEEVGIMLDDIDAAREAGADGVVIGALLPDGSIDMDACRRMSTRAKGMNLTFHRAFDLCADADKALMQLADLGCNRVLTSGQSPTALAGVEKLRHLNELAGEKITILAGSGVNPGNAKEILDRSGVHELHASARSRIGSKMGFRNEGVAMGAPDSDEYSRMTTDPAIVSQLSNIIKDHN